MKYFDKIVNALSLIDIKYYIWPTNIKYLHEWQTISRGWSYNNILSFTIEVESQSRHLNSQMIEWIISNISWIHMYMCVCIVLSHTRETYHIQEKLCGGCNARTLGFWTIKGLTRWPKTKTYKEYMKLGLNLNCFVNHTHLVSI